MSLAGYSEYKESGLPWVGPIPQGWDVLPLLGVASERGESNKGMAEDNLLSLSYGRIVQKDMTSNDGLLPESFETYQVVHPDDIVFRLTDLQNDKRSLRTAPVTQKGIITSAYLAVVPRCINTRYFAYLLRSYDLTKVFYSMGGGLRQSMKYDDVKRLPILAPNPIEQMAIADFLDRETAKIDALIAEQETLLTLLAEKRHATISHAVTRGLDPDVPMKDSGIAWLGEVPGHWEILMLRRVVDHFEQGWSPECEARLPEVGEWAVLKAGCVNGGEFAPDECKALPQSLDPMPHLEIKAGDVLMSRASGSPKLIGSVAVLDAPPERLMLSDKIFRLRLAAGVVAKYFALSMKSVPLRQQIEQAIGGADGLANNLSQASIKSFWIALPPEHEQQDIVRRIDVEERAHRGLCEAAERAISLLRERRSALIAAAVTGKIDVRGQVEAQAA